MATVLFVSDQLPSRQIGLSYAGHAQYASSFLNYFERRGDTVVFLLFDPKIDFTSERADKFRFRLVGPTLAERNGRIFVCSAAALCWSIAWRCFARLPISIQRTLAQLRRVVRHFRGFSHRMGRFRTRSEKNYFDKIVGEVQPDIVAFDGIFNYCGAPPGAEVWMITQEVKSQRARSFEEEGYTVAPAGLDSAAEAAILSRCKNIIAIQWDDAEVLRDMCPDSRIVVVPASFDPPRAVESRQVEGRCLFVASASFHNVQGLQWFLDACWPAILERHPTATLLLCGSVGSQLVRVPRNVYDYGVVEDLTSVYGSAQIVVVPLRIGSGLKVKLVQGILHAVPIVTTSVGAQGLAALTPRPFWVADTATDFAEAVCSLIERDVARLQLIEHCRDAAVHFSPHAAFAELGEALHLNG